MTSLRGAFRDVAICSLYLRRQCSVSVGSFSWQFQFQFPVFSVQCSVELRHCEEHFATWQSVRCMLEGSVQCSVAVGSFSFQCSVSVGSFSLQYQVADSVSV